MSRTVYVFMTKRDQDGQEWPLAYFSRELAENAPHRTSAVVEVHVPDTGDFSQIICNVVA